MEPSLKKGDIIAFPESMGRPPINAIIVETSTDGPYGNYIAIPFKEYKWKFFMRIQFSFIKIGYNLSKRWESLIKIWRKTLQ